MADAELLSFTAGMLATVNPCALPMLPAYLSYYISGDEPNGGSPVFGRAVAVGLTVSAGFVTVFGAFGLAATAASTQLERYTPKATLVIGLALAGLGLFMALGRDLKLRLPRMSTGLDGRGLASMFVYGAGYAIVSVSCTLGIFLVHVSTTFGQSWGTGLRQLLAFAVGFSLVLVALSVSAATAGQRFTMWLRQALPHIGKVSGMLLVVTGLYLAWYGWAEIRLSSGPSSDPIIERVNGWSGDLSAFVNDHGAATVGIFLAVLVAIAGLSSAARSRSRRSRNHPSP